MPVKNRMYQPGAILHAVIAGALRTQGETFEGWCRKNSLYPNTVRMATYGQSSGPVGQDILERLIDAAGREIVEQAYCRQPHAGRGGAARGGAGMKMHTGSLSSYEPTSDAIIRRAS